MNKKGFTLIEIIVCLVLISLISTISIVAINKNKSNKNDKLINTVISSADVYYSMNNNLKAQLNKNYGYLVVKIEDLKNNGLLDKNFTIPVLTEKEKEAGKSYEKLVIVNKTVQNNKYQLLSNDDDLGYVDYIYPYEENKPFIVNLDDVSIENFEKNEFKCNSLLKDKDGNNTESLYYLDENYETKSTDNFKCNYKDEKKDEKSSSDTLFKDAEAGTTYSIEYKIGGINSSLRNVTIYKVPSFKLEMKDKDGYIYTSGNWSNKSINVCFEDDNSVGNNYTERGLKYFFDGNENETNCKIFTESSGGKAQYQLYGKLKHSNELLDFNNNEYTIKIDKIPPEINFNYINNTATFSDDGGSGIDKYGVSDSNSCTPTENIEGRISVTDKKYYCVKDNAGNITTLQYNKNNEVYPNIIVTPIDNSLSQFKVTINDNNGIDVDNIKMYFGYDTENTLLSNCGRGGCIEAEENRYKEIKDLFGEGSKSSYNKVNISPTINTDNRIEFIVNMQDAIEKCGNYSMCASNRRYGCDRACPYYVNYEKLIGLLLKYEIEVTNKNNKKTIYKFNSKINMELKNNYKNFFWIDNTYWAKIISVNENGDLIYERREGTGRGKPDRYSYYYYNNSENKTYAIFEDTPTWDVTSKYFDNDGFYYCSEEDVDDDHCYYYDLKTHNHCDYYRNYKKCSKIFSYSYKKHSIDSKYNLNYKYGNYKESIDNSGLIDFLISYDRKRSYLREWEYFRHGNDSSHFAFGSKSESIINSKILFNNTIDNENWYSLNLIEDFTSASGRREYEVIQVFFKPGVTIIPTNLEYKN